MVTVEGGGEREGERKREKGREFFLFSFVESNQQYYHSFFLSFLFLSSFFLSISRARLFFSCQRCELLGDLCSDKARLSAFPRGLCALARARGVGRRR